MSTNLVSADPSNLLEWLIASLEVDPETEQAWDRKVDLRKAGLETDSDRSAPARETEL